MIRPARHLPWLAFLALTLPVAARAAPGVEIEIEDDDAPPTPSKPPPAAPTSSAPRPLPAAPTTRDPRAAAGIEAVPNPERAPATEPAPPPASNLSPAPGASEPVPPTSDEITQLREQLAALQNRLQLVEDERRAERAARTTADSPLRITKSAQFVRVGDDSRAGFAPTSIGFGPGAGVTRWGIRLTGYIQAQYQHNQMSEDQVQQGGVLLNQDRFVIRRGRLRVAGDWRWVAFDFELDGSTTRGPFVGVRQANLSFLWRNPDATRPPYVMVTAGLTEAPFGYELRLGQREMMFMERTRGSLAFFPGPVDVGLRVRGGLAAFRYDLAVMNGTPLDDRAGNPNVQDPTRAPDYIGRFGFEARPKQVTISGGISLLYGTGFHRGNDASKNHLEWSDLNENGAIDTGELVAVPGQAATPSLTFRRWAVGADFQLAIRSKAGFSQILAEGTLAGNLDRDLIVADPIVVGSDLRELHGTIAFLQDLYGRAVFGARYDYYDPNSDLLDRRRGEFVPLNAAIHTISPLVGALLPRDLIPGVRGRLVFQYDAVLDSLGRDARGVPANLKNDQFILRLQGEF